jgi:hypothetical protein
LSSDRSGIDSNADGSFDQLTPDDEGWLWIANQATLDERRTALEFDVADVDAASLVSVVLRVSIHGYGLPEPPPSPAPSLAFYVYSGDGVVDLADMTRTNVPLTTISLYPIPYPSYSYLIDATEAVRSLREQGVSHVGFLVTPTPGNYYVLLLSGEGIPRLPIDRPMLAIEQWESVRPEQPSSTRPSIAPPQR